MYDIVKVLHSYWAYLVLLVLLLATINALVKFFGKKEFHAKDFRISLFSLIVSHIQLLLGLVLYFVSPRMQLWAESGMGGIMKDAVNRMYLVEHPLINIIAVALITIGYSKHKKKLTSTPKFKMLALFYTIALVLYLSRIPWDAWPN
jgi:archaellum biogenesis protein FlaJ (TadC family)